MSLSPNIKGESMVLLSEIQERAQGPMRDYAMNSFRGTQEFQNELCDRIYQLATVVRILMADTETQVKEG